MSKEKVTIYTTDEFLGGITKIEARLVDCGYRKYAQYDNAPYVEYIPKGKRKARYIVRGYKPTLVVIKGWGHADPASPWDTRVEGGLVVQHARYLAHDPAWVEEFKQLPLSGEVLLSEIS